MARRITNLIKFHWNLLRHCKDAMALPLGIQMLGQAGNCYNVAMIVRSWKFVLLAVLVIASTDSAWAQETSESTRNIQFWAYRVGSGNWSGIRFEAGNQEVDTLSLGKFMKGRVHEYHGPASLLPQCRHFPWNRFG